MDFLEKDLEEILFTADREQLAKRGLKIEGIMKRQLRIGNYGVADLVTFNRVSKIYSVNKDLPDNYLEVTIYELKKDKIGISAFLQALGYLKGIDSYLKKRKPNLDCFFRIVLIGKRIDENSTFIYLTDYFAYLRNYTFKYTVNGIQFKREYGYNLIEEGF